MYCSGILRGNWNNGVICGSQSSNWNNSPLNLNSNNSGRGATDTESFIVGNAELNCPLADIFTLLIYVKSYTAKYTTTVSQGLVTKVKVLEKIIL